MAFAPVSPICFISNRYNGILREKRHRGGGEGLINETDLITSAQFLKILRVYTKFRLICRPRVLINFFVQLTSDSHQRLGKEAPKVRVFEKL